MTNKRFLSILIAISIVLSSCSSNSIREEKFDNGKLKLQYQVIKKGNDSDIKNGYYKQWFDNGQLEVVGEYIDDKETGTWKWFYKTGKLAKEGAYKNGLKEGAWKEYAENGQVVADFHYLQEGLDGLQKSWYDNGQKKCEQMFTKGMANGMMTIWDKNGTVQNEYKFENGKNLTLIGDYYMLWKEDTATTSKLIWSFGADGIAKRNYIPQTDMWKAPYQILNCSIDKNVENIFIVVEGDAPSRFEVLFANEHELRLRDGNELVKNERRLVRVKQ